MEHAVSRQQLLAAVSLDSFPNGDSDHSVRSMLHSVRHLLRARGTGTSLNYCLSAVAIKQRCHRTLLLDAERESL